MASECVKVMVRCRPMNSKETNRGCNSICEIDKPTNQVILRPNEEGGPDEKIFAYDSVYGVDSKQQEVYDETAFPLVESVIGGYNGTIFAYGQTGCGKTHTMCGLKDKENQGIIPNAFEHIYGYIDDQANIEKKFLVRCSYVEIYNEEIRDLLGDDPTKKLELKEDPQKGIFIKDLAIVTVKSIREIDAMMNTGNSLRQVGKTAMNDTSSRSHSLFTIYIETAETIKAKQRFKVGKLNLVDLAGSERQSKTQATGVRLKEATKINLSLSALGNVISALVDGRQTHIPYRDSKLTRLLQDSLGGNTKTVMIAAISPADYNLDETLSTLRYASRAKSIKNKPRVNEDPKDALLKQYEDEIKRLKAMLEAGGPGAAQALKAATGGAAAANSNMSNIEAALGAQRQASTESLNPKRRDTIREETVEALLEKLAKKGQKVKILGDGEEETQKDQVKKQAEEMNQLQELMSNMEAQLVKGGEALEEAEKQKSQDQRKLQLELEEERKRQQALMEERQQAEEELMQKDAQYNSLQEEVESQRKIIKKLRQKYKQAESELKAQTYDQDDVRLDLTDTIREQEKDLDFLNAIVGMMLKEGEMYRLKEKIDYDFESGKWKVPPFLIKNKEVAFPKIKAAMNLVRDELDNREVVMADTGEVLSQGSRSSGSKYGRNGIPNTFKANQPQVSGGPNQRSKRKKIERHKSTADGAMGNSVDSQNGNGPPFQYNNSSRSKAKRQGSVEEGAGNARFNNDYYQSGKNNLENQSQSSSERDNLDVPKASYGGGPTRGMSQFENHASQMSMKRNDSDFNAGQRTMPKKSSGKYNSIESNGMLDENQVSPMIMKKKANVHLQPMSHKKAHLMKTGLSSHLQPSAELGGMGHSESNPLLQPTIINDRVKLERLNHIPSVKSNLMQAASDNMSQSNLDAPGINYEAMPLGKKSVLAPINMLNGQNEHPVFSKMDNSASMMNRKNNRTLKPLKR